jgi:hypothetical protein
MKNTTDSVSGKPKRIAYHEAGSPLVHAEINMRIKTGAIAFSALKCQKKPKRDILATSKSS